MNYKKPMLATQTDINPLLAYFLLGDFLAILKERGFVVDIEDYLVAVNICKQINNKTVKSINSIKYQLSAVICRNEDEQILFFKIFDKNILKKEEELNNKIKLIKETIEKFEKEEAEKEIAQKKEEKRKKRLQNLKKILLSIVLFTFCICVVFFCIPHKTPYAAGKYVSTKNEHYTIKDLFNSYILLDNPNQTKWDTTQNLYQQLFNKKFDSSKTQANWHFDDTIIKNTKSVSHQFKSIGKKKINIEIKTPISTIENTDSIVVCDERPNIIYNDKITVNKKTSFTIDNGIKQPLLWKIDQKDTVTNGVVLNYIFTTVGLHTISCKYQNQFCIHDRNTVDVNVVTDNEFNLIATQSSIKHPIYKSSLTSLYKILFFFFLYSTVIGIVLLFGFKKIINNEDGIANGYLKGVNLPLFDGKKSPFDISFNNKNSLIRQKDFIQKWALDLKKKVELQETDLSLPKTIHATIQNFDLFTPIFSNKSDKRCYLFLIDESYVKSPQINLFKYLVKQLSNNQIELELYYYFKTPNQVYKKDIDDKIDINYIKNRHYQSVLIVFSNGYNFLDTNLPEIDLEKKKIFSYWTNRMLITPIPSKDWSLNEKILASYFHIVPADVDGLLGIYPLLQKTLYNQQVINTEKYNDYATKFIDFEDISKLREYLKIEELFQWVAALSVYPKLVWPITLAIGNALSSNLLTYYNLLKINRIEWIQSGSLPMRIRLELLKNLDIDNEIKVRETIIKLLEEESLQIENTFSSNERKMQLIVNKFVLYSYNPEKYFRYLEYEKQFLLLYKDGKIRDIPLKVYLKKNDPDYDYNDTRNNIWDNPIDGKEKKTNLDEYYNRKTGTNNPSKRQFFKYLIPFALLFVVLGLIGIIKPKNINFLVKQSPIATNNWSVKFINDDCFKKFRATQLLIFNTRGVKFKKTAIIKDIRELDNFQQITGSTIKFELLNSSGKSIYDSIILNNENIELNIVGQNCRPILDTIIIEYNNSSVKNNADNLLKTLINNGYKNVSANKIADKIDSNQIIYSREKLTAVQKLNSILLNNSTIIFGASESKLQNSNRIIKIRLANNTSPIPIFIQYSPSRLFNSMDSFRKRMNTDKIFYCEGIDSVKVPEKTKVKYFNNESHNQAIILSKYARKYFKYPDTIPVNKLTLASTKNKNARIELWINNNEIKPKLLWVDDEPEKNNKGEINYFRANNIIVDLARTNKEAYDLLNTNVYSYIITDIKRNYLEAGVSDKDYAGLEFTRCVNFPKNFIVVCSDVLNPANQTALGSNGILSSNLNSDKEKLKIFILSAIKNGNKKLFTQQPCNSICLPKKEGNTYTLYFKSDKSGFTAESEELINKDLIQNIRYKFSDLSDTVQFYYSSAETSNNSKVISNLYEQFFIDYFKSRKVDMQGVTYKSSDMGIRTKDCDKVEITIQKPAAKL